MFGFCQCLNLKHMKNFFKRKHPVQKNDLIDTKYLMEMNSFYSMLIKMKKKRPNLNIAWIMTNLYGKNYIKSIKQ